MGKRRQCPGSQHPEHPLQNRPRPYRVLLLQGIDREDVVADIRPNGRHLFFAEDVDAGHLDETATFRETGKARVDEPLAGQTVEHHGDPGAGRSIQNFLAERSRAAVEHVFHAAGAQEFPLPLARRGEHLGARRPGQLDRREPDAPGPGVNQHAVLSVQSREFE